VAEMPRSGRPKWGLDVLAGGALLGLLVGVFAVGFHAGPSERAIKSVLIGLYVQVWGLLFIISYFRPSASHLVAAVRWFCEHWPPRGRWTALLWGPIALVAGTLGLLTGIGVLP
jgi:hypothetical protein